MKPTIRQIDDLDGNTVSLTFTEGCVMVVRIIETIHLDEGNDFVADVLRVQCDDESHYHPELGTAINISVDDIGSIMSVEQDESSEDGPTRT